VKRGRRAREIGLLFPRMKPTQIVTAHAIEGLPEGGYRAEGAEVHSAENGFEHLEIRDGTWRLFFVFEARKGGAVPILPDTPLLGRLFDSAHGLLVPRALDFDPFTLRVLEVERVALEGRWEPGANVTVARVWRGQTAIPSAEAVVRTQVDEKGRIAFPRLAGELGSTLRMLVRTKDGTSTFHDVVVAPELRTTPRLDLTLGADGVVSAPGWTVDLLDEPWAGDEATGMPAPERFAALIARLEWHAGRPEQRDAKGNSKTELALRAGKDVPWRLVQWVLQAAADPRVRIHAIQFVLLAQGQTQIRPLPLDLPLDEGLSADPELQVSVRLLRTRADGLLEIRCGGEGGNDEVVAWEALPARLRATAEGLRETGPWLVGLIRVPPPGLVTFAEANRVLRAFREAGFEDVRLEGAPLR
jgi:hypothetical protein